MKRKTKFKSLQEEKMKMKIKDLESYYEFMVAGWLRSGRYSFEGFKSFNEWEKECIKNVRKYLSVQNN